MRLIDADALESSLGVEEEDIYAKIVIREAPEIDAVEVVRCEECFWWDKAKVNKKGFLICPISGMEIHNYDYCSYGERKDKDG